MTQPSGDQQQQPGEGEGGGGTTTATQAAPKPGEQPGGQQPPRTFTQEDFNRFEANVKRTYREKAEQDAELIELGKQAKEALDAKRPLEERVTTLTTEAQAVARERDDLRVENRRIKLAGKANLHPDLWDRVRGNTEEEILADIETLKPFSPAPTNGTEGAPPQGSSVTPNPQQGVPSSSDNKGSVQAGRDLFKQRHGTNK